MKKIGLYTIQGLNYGNRLQNYAAFVYLQKLGLDVVTFKTDFWRKKGKDKANQIKLPCFYFIIGRLIQIKDFIKMVFSKKIRNFREFDKNIKYTADYISGYDSNINIENYDVLVVGSDQVWNTNFTETTLNSFLPFSGIKKISFSSSFGEDRIPYDDKIKESLSNFDFISVREEEGVKIVSDITGKNAQVLIDPTLLLTKDEWKTISKKPKKMKEEDSYVLTYFLSPKSQDANKRLDEIRNDKKIFELLNESDESVRDSGPSEFLWLFEHADLILTDSFHACIFSLIFNKPFIVYDRNWNGGNMNSRLNTFLKKFKLERKYSNSLLKNNLWEHDYAESYSILEKEKEKTYLYLKKALDL